MTLFGLQPYQSISGISGQLDLILNFRLGLHIEYYAQYNQTQLGGEKPKIANLSNKTVSKSQPDAAVKIVLGPSAPPDHSSVVKPS